MRNILIDIIATEKVNGTWKDKSPEPIKIQRPKSYSCECQECEKEEEAK